MRSPHKLLTGTLVLLSLLLVSCLKPTPPPATLAARFLTSIHVNPNSVGKPSPIVVQYYELQSTAAFETTDFFTLTDKDRSVLGQDLLSHNEMEIPPGTERVINRELHPSTRYIGVVAAYRDLEQAHWRTVVPITPHTPNAFVFRLGKATISVSDPATVGKGKASSADQSKFDF